MSGLNDLTAQAIGAPDKFNWPWFVELCVCGIIVLFFLFYFDRLFATLLSYGIRAYSWHHYRVWVDIQALQISLLGGRIFFKGIRYHGENETIYIHNGYVTWRYWFRNVRQVDLISNETSKGKPASSLPEHSPEALTKSSLDSDEETGAISKPDNSEARIAVSVTGLEWFIYNRTPLYDAIIKDTIDTLQEDEQPRPSIRGVPDPAGVRIRLPSRLRRKPKSTTTSSSETSETTGVVSEKPDHIQRTKSSLAGHSSVPADLEPVSDDITPAQSFLIKVLPIYIDCSHAAISIGNEYTRAILVTSLEKATGHIDARGCGPDDIFRQVFEFDIQHPSVQMRPNPDFLGTQTSVAEQLISETDTLYVDRRWWHWHSDLRRRRHEAVRAIRNLVPGLQSSVESLHHGKSRARQNPSRFRTMQADQDGGQWHGLDRYMDEDHPDDRQTWSNIDYARFSTILECPGVQMTFYWDTPGRVKAHHIASGRSDDNPDIDGVESPSYGLDLAIRGGSVNYGPWADRLRAEIQTVFFPASYKSATATKPLKPGQWRQSTSMTIRIDIEEEVTLRVPTKESSKDWRWRGRATAVRDAAVIRKQRQKRHFRLRRGPKGLLGPDIRPFGWISVSVSANSTVRYTMDLLAGRGGYSNQLQMDLKNTTATSSVNHADLWRCPNQRLSCDLSNPLVWNNQHTWRFDVEMDSMEMFLLRDHMFLLTDLIDDFTAGQKSSYMTFTPFEYKIGLRFNNWKLYLNANDFNIIDSPCELESNAFLVLGFNVLEGNVDIPMKYFSPSQSSVIFRAHGNELTLDFKAPVWNTLHSFLSDENMATVKSLDLDGSYNYHSGTSAVLSDSLLLDIVGNTPKVYLQGFLIRYFMNVKENYFGEDLHFRTLEEYQNLLGPDNRLATDEQQRPSKKDNDLDVILNVRAENSCALMPSNIYIREQNLRIDIMLIEADMRFTNYYMDLQVNSSPVEVCTESHSIVHGIPTRDTSACQLFIDAVSVYGHRLFGAPPTEPTYVCNWDFDVGLVQGECSTDFVRTLLAAVQSFVFTLDDDENALPVTRAGELHDVTFLRAKLAGVEISVITDMATTMLEVGQSWVAFDDLAGQHFSKDLKAHVPSIVMAVIDTRESSLSQGKTTNSTIACIQTSIHIINIDKKAHFQHQRQLQQYHIKFHDMRTRRAHPLLHNSETLVLSAKELLWGAEPPAIPVPDLTPPIASTSKKNFQPLHRVRRGQQPRPRSFLSSEASADSQMRRRTSQVTQMANKSKAPHHSRFPHSSSTKEFSSPWKGPPFAARRPNPDFSQMPNISAWIDGEKEYYERQSAYGAEQDFTDSDEDLAHAAIYCSLPQGIRAFCSPALFPTVVHLLQAIAPKDPQSLLDSIQQSVLKRLKSSSMIDRGEKLDFAIRVPAAALRLVSETTSGRNPDGASRDLYELTLSGGRLNGRTAPTVTKRSHGQTKQNVLLLQASIQNIDIILTEAFRAHVDDHAKLSTSIRDVDFWFSLQDAMRGKLQMSSLEVSTGGSTVDRFSAFVERTRVMSSKAGSTFADLDLMYDSRHLVYHLCLLNMDTTEPVFLSRPSYVLRTAVEHVRSADSWKILSRFRQRLTMQSADERIDLVGHRSCMFEKQQDKAQQQIVDLIDSWRTWDGDHEASGPILQAIFGIAPGVNAASTQSIDLELGVYLGQISVLLDPGPQQSQLLLQSGDLNISQKPVLDHNPSRDHAANVGRSKLRMSVWFADVSLDLNWNLVELARSLVKQMNLSSTSTANHQVQVNATKPETLNNMDLMVTAGTDFGTARIRTINVDIHGMMQNIQANAVVQSFDSGLTLSLLLASTSAQLKVNSRQSKLFNWRLKAPTLYGSFQQDHSGLQNNKAARFAASCDRLRFDMRDDVLSVLEVVDIVVRNEAMVIQEIINSVEQQTTVATRTSQSPVTSLRLDDVHIAFFLSNYKLRFCLLPSLHYSVAGMVARTSIVPRRASTFAIHIDVKSNTHTLIEPRTHRRTSPATLEIPPLSSRVIFGITKDAIKVNARSTLERVRIETNAVQACVEAAYKPQNIQRVKDYTKLIQRLQSSVTRLEKASLHKKPAQEPQPHESKSLLYSGEAIFEGVDVRCRAPTTAGQNRHAELKFGLQETTFKIHNYHKAENIPMRKPQFSINIHQAFMNLARGNEIMNQNYGRFSMDLSLRSINLVDEDNGPIQNYKLHSYATQLDLFAESATLVLDIATFLQERINEITTVEELQKIRPLRRLTLANNDVRAASIDVNDSASESAPPSNVFDTTFSLDLNSIRVRWIVTQGSDSSGSRIPEDLVFSIRQIDLRTQRESSARLTILDLQLQTVSKGQEDPVTRTANSALLPEMIFNAAHFSTKKDRRFAFQAAGKALDLRLAADGILPLSAIQKSIAQATADIRNAKMVPDNPSSEKASDNPLTSFLGNKRLSSLLVDADFAGAVVKIAPRSKTDDHNRSSAFGLLKGPKRSKANRYGQAIQGDDAREATLRAPGIAVKVEYVDNGKVEPTMSTEVKVAASSNTLAPTVVPLVLEIYSSVKEIIGEDNSNDKKPDLRTPAQKYLSEATIVETSPTAILGRVRLNAGLWVQRQEFSLTCQPVARVAATAKFDDIFLTINTVQDGEQERFFSIITTFNRLQVSVQHVYSRESTASFEVDSIVMSLMNSKHVNSRSGISAILNVSPMKSSLNVKQMQDFLLFREIWYPAEIRGQSQPAARAPTTNETQAYAMQKYHELATTAALPWHAIVSIHELKLEVDFGQSLGKSSFMISKLWASSKKNSNWEQNLCIGFDRVGVDSSGRMSGFVEMREFRARTSIRWPAAKDSRARAPLVQGSIGFGHLRLKTAFDYQPFAVAEISSFEFLMYNVRSSRFGGSDRLVGILNGGKVQMFCISTAAAQALSIVQAFERLFQEKKDAFQESLRELDQLMRRKSMLPSTGITTNTQVPAAMDGDDDEKANHRLHTDVVVTLNTIDVGVFPSSFFDNQIFKIEAVDAQARFAVATVDGRLRSGLGMSLGQVRVALSSISKTNTRALGEVEIDEVIERATSSRGGTILKVPRLVASMQTWQDYQSFVVEYVFRSTFQGKVDVGWNYSRIRFIRGMWETHSEALAHRLGKPLPPSAVKITTGSGNDNNSPKAGQEKITAVVTMPQSTKFQYVALEPPIIETPQLRDMGEATPPLEWIGLHRDKLPNVTHSIVIVFLLEVAKEVEDAYTRILGAG